jgi:hypothetical protein
VSSLPTCAYFTFSFGFLSLSLKGAPKVKQLITKLMINIAPRIVSIMAEVMTLLPFDLS